MISAGGDNSIPEDTTPAIRAQLQLHGRSMGMSAAAAASTLDVLEAEREHVRQQYTQVTLTTPDTYYCRRLLLSSLTTLDAYYFRLAEIWKIHQGGHSAVTPR